MSFKKYRIFYQRITIIFFMKYGLIWENFNIFEEKLSKTKRISRISAWLLWNSLKFTQISWKILNLMVRRSFAAARCTKTSGPTFNVFVKYGTIIIQLEFKILVYVQNPPRKKLFGCFRDGVGSFWGKRNLESTVNSILTPKSFEPLSKVRTRRIFAYPKVNISRDSLFTTRLVRTP